MIDVAKFFSSVGWIIALLQVNFQNPLAVSFIAAFDYFFDLLCHSFLLIGVRAINIILTEQVKE